MAVTVAEILRAFMGDSFLQKTGASEVGKTSKETETLTISDTKMVSGQWSENARHKCRWDKQLHSHPNP